MKTFLISLLLCFAAPSAAAAQGFEDDGVDQILVIINDQILTESQVMKIASQILARRPDLDMQQASGIALNTGIRRILYQESFNRLGLDDSLLDPQVAARIQTMISEDGSRQRFINKVALDGYTSLEDFQEALRYQFVEQTVAGIVSGQIPSPQQGMRQIGEPTPAEMRKAYNTNSLYRERPAEFEWASLKFMNDKTSAPAAERAAETSNRLRAGLISIQSAEAKADRVTYYTEIQEGISKDLENFLKTAASGDCMELPSSSSNVVQLILITKRTEARSFTFAEAQLFIAEELKLMASQLAVEQELSEIYTSSYIWVSPQIQWLRDSLDEAFGRGISGHPAEEV